MNLSLQTKYLPQSTVIALMLVWCSHTQAAERVELDHDFDKPNAANTTSNTKSNLTTSPDLTKSINAQLGLTNEELRPVRSQQYVNGKIVTRYQQFHQGVPIFGETITEQLTPGVEQRSLSGAMLRQITKDIPNATPFYQAEQALTLAKTRAQTSSTENDQAHLYVRQNSHQIAQLIYLVSFIDTSHPNHPSRPHFMIDANTGAILERWEGLTHAETGTGPGGNLKTGQYEFGTTSGFSFLNVTANGATCKLSSPNVDTYDMHNSSAGSGTLHSFTCPRNTVKPVNGAYAPMNDAHYFGSQVFNMYQTYLGVRPISQKLKMKVHYGVAYENAFWDGSSMNFGDGASSFYPLTSLDVTGHEVSHGFTEQNSDLVYAGMSGGMNEAFSDMAGEAVKYFVKGSNDFKVGADIIKANGALRYMYNPPLDGSSIDHASKYTSNLDVHDTSGVYNKAFYLISTSPDWNTRKAFEIMADANRLYWTSNSTFNQGACGVEKAAASRNYRVADVTSAFKAVGVSCPSASSTITLKKGVSIDNINLVGGASQLYKIQVPASAKKLNIIRSGSGGTIYVKAASAASTSSYDTKSSGSGSSEIISILSPEATTYYLLFYATTDVSGASLMVTY